MALNKMKLLLHLLLLYTTAHAYKSGGLRQHQNSVHSTSRKLTSCDAASNESPWKLALTVDDYPWETRWTIKDSSGNKVAYGPPDNMNYEKRTEYEETGCLSPGEYVFTVKDRGGDGLCCAFGDGSYEFTVNNDVIAVSDGDAAFKKLDYPFTVKEVSASSIEVAAVDGEIMTDTSTSPPTDEPSTKPTSRPTPSPTVKPVSKTPTESPSFSPTWTPTVTPSFSPAMFPTTDRPTRRPSRKPRTMTPSLSPTAKPTRRPSRKPRTMRPSISPTLSPTNPPSNSPTMSPSTKPTGMPVTPWPTYEPSGSPTGQPSSSPSAPPTAVPTASPSFRPTTTPTSAVSYPPSEFPSISPSTATPTSAPVYPPSISPSMSPITTNPTLEPSMIESEMPSRNESSLPSMIQSEFLSKEVSADTSSITESTTVSSMSESEVPVIATTYAPITPTNVQPSLQYSTPPSRSTLLQVPITPFSLFITTNETEIDLDELESILTDHLLEQMQTNLPKSTEVNSVELLLMDITMNERRLKKDKQNEENVEEGDDSTSNVTDSVSTTAPTPVEVVSTTTTHEISVSGDAYFGGTALPTTEQLDDVTSSAFMGDAGNEFIQDLLSAEDPGLQSTVGISVPIDDSGLEFYEGFLFVEGADPPTESAFNALYVVGAIFVVGLLLVAAFVHRIRQAKRNRSLEDDFVIEPNDVKEDDENLPTFISITPVECEQCEPERDCKPMEDCTEGCGNCFIDNIVGAPSEASTEVASNQTYSSNTKQKTLSTKEDTMVTLDNLVDPSIKRSQPVLYQIKENQEDTNQNQEDEQTNTVGMFCGFNAANIDDHKDDKSRFGTESQWGMKPTDSQDTSDVQKERCNMKCN